MKFKFVVCLIIICIISQLLNGSVNAGFGVKLPEKLDVKTSDISSISNNGSIMVLVEANGNIRTSTDSYYWKLCGFRAENQLNKVVWGSKCFIAVGDKGTILRSPDALTWKKVSVGISTNLNSIIWTGSQFIIAGNNGMILTSKDGNTWKPSTVGKGYDLNSISWSGNKLIVTGNQKKNELYNSIILTSSNSTKWVRRTLDKTLISKAFWDGSKFILAGAEYIDTKISYTSPMSGTTHEFMDKRPAGIILSSNYGNSFVKTKIKDSCGYGIFDIIKKGNKYTGLTYRSIVESNDGLNWNVKEDYGKTPLDQVSYNHRFTGLYSELLVYKGDVIVVGKQGSIRIQNANGFSQLYVEAPANSVLRDILWDGKRFVSVGSVRKFDYYGTEKVHSLIGYSRDGISWVFCELLIEDGSTSDRGLNSIAYDGKRYVAVGNKSTMLISADGKSWKRIEAFPNLKSSDPNYNFYEANSCYQNISWTGKEFVVVGNRFQNGDGHGFVLTSSDCVDWRKALDNANVLYCQASNLNGTLVVGGANVIETLVDGMDWQVYKFGGENEFARNIIWNGSKFVAFVSNGSNVLGKSYKPYMLTSSDGISWKREELNTPVMPDTISDLGKVYLGIASYYDDKFEYRSSILESYDGIVWGMSKDINNKISVEKICSNGKRFAGVGYGYDDGIKYFFTLCGDIYSN